MEALLGGSVALEHRYDIQRARGRVAHITLYEGSRDPFEMPIALRVYALDGGASDALRDRLFEVAWRTSDVRHEALLRPLDHGELEPGVPFIICEGLDAPTLEDHLVRHGTLAPEQVVSLISRLASALEALHARGVAHGGVQPDWILLPEGDPAKAILSHAGLSLTLDELLESAEPALDEAALRALAPELLRGEQASFSVEGDLYALATLAYTCLVGVHPFFQHGADPEAGIARAAREQARPLHELGVDVALSEAIAQGMSLDPSARGASARELADSLSDALRPRRDAAAPHAHHAPREAPPRASDSSANAPSSDSLQPSRAGSAAALAIIALIISNLSWCAYALSQAPPEPAPQARAAGAAQQPSAAPATTPEAPSAQPIER